MGTRAVPRGTDCVHHEKGGFVSVTDLSRVPRTVPGTDPRFQKFAERFPQPICRSARLRGSLLAGLSELCVPRALVESSRGWSLEGTISKVCGRGEAKGTAVAPELEAPRLRPLCLPPPSSLEAPGPPGFLTQLLPLRRCPRQ